MPNRRGAEEGAPAASPSLGKPLLPEAARGRAMPSAEVRAALAEENAEDEAGADPRLRFLGAYVVQGLRPAAGAWERCAGTAEAERLLHAFLGRDAAEGPQPLLVVRPGPGAWRCNPGWTRDRTLARLELRAFFSCAPGPSRLGPTASAARCSAGTCPQPLWSTCPRSSPR